MFAVLVLRYKLWRLNVRRRKRHRKYRRDIRNAGKCPHPIATRDNLAMIWKQQLANFNVQEMRLRASLKRHQRLDGVDRR